MSLNMNPTIGTPLFQTSPAGSYTGSTGLSPQQLNTMVMGGTPSATLPASSSGFGNVIGGLGDIFGGLMGAGQSILSSPDALMGLGGGLLTKEAYDRLSDIGEQAKREAMGLAERGQMESEFRPFTVTTPTGAMFTARMGGQPSMGQPMPQPVGQPSMMLPPLGGVESSVMSRGDQLLQDLPQMMQGNPALQRQYDSFLQDSLKSYQTSPIIPQGGARFAAEQSAMQQLKRSIMDQERLAGLSDQLLQAPSSSQFAPPPGMPARPEMPMFATADMVQFTDPITGRQMTGSGTLQQYRRQLKDYYDATPGAQQYYENLERQAQAPARQPSSSMGGILQNLTGMLPTQPTADGLQIGMELSPEERALQQQLISGAGGFFGQAAQPTVDREQAIFERMRAAQRPEEERQRLALEERLAAQGRLGASSAAYGGATPELLALSAAEREARDRSMLTAMQQAQAEQAQQAALGGQFLGAGYLPQQQLVAALQPGLIQQELAQQAQQFGTGLFGETALSGIEAQLLQEQARANLLGGIGSNLITGLMNQQRAAAAQPSGGGSSGLGGLFGDIVDDLGTVGSGIRRLFNF